jgi:MarR family transcriptional regulator, organic hydroperoxide resistance regulator
VLYAGGMDLNDPTARHDGSSARDLPLDRSVGYQIRATHRLIQRALQARIEPHGVTLGMWYFLRVLWEQDGITQSELSQRVDTREPTTLSAIRDMEKSGYVRRVPHAEDRRKINIYLTEQGRALQDVLLPLAINVLETVHQGLTEREITLLLGVLSCIQRNLQK